MIVGKGVGCHRETQQHVYCGRGYYVLRGAVDVVASSVVAKNLVTLLDLGQPTVVLDEGLKDIYRQ